MLPSTTPPFARSSEMLARKDMDGLLDYRRQAPAGRRAHPTLDHVVPLVVAVDASLDSGAELTTATEGFSLGSSKPSVELRSSTLFRASVTVLRDQSSVKGHARL